jgi:hypothetical protein
VSDEDFNKFQEEIPQIEKRKCPCKWCGKEIDINEYSSKYGSSDNPIEICHRDPKERFIIKNMYWGHGECNRRQGGYSEKDRIDDGLRLLLLHKNITQEIYDDLKAKATVPTETS